MSRFGEGIQFGSKLVDAASSFFFAGDDATGFENAEVVRRVCDFKVEFLSDFAYGEGAELEKGDDA